MAFPQNWSNAMANPEVPVNENFATLAHAATYGKNPATSTGLTWGYFGGRWGGTVVADGTLTLANNSNNYIVVEIATSTISVSSSDTNWNNTDEYARVYLVATASGAVTGTPQDHRAGAYGISGGGGSGGSSSETVKLVTGTTYTFLLGDNGKLLSFSDATSINAYFEQVFPAGWWVDVQLRGDDSFFVSAPGSPTILLDGIEDGIILLPGQGMRIVSDGIGYYTNRGGGGYVMPSLRLIDRIVVGDETTALTTGTAKFKWRSAQANYMDGIRASLNVAQASGAQLVTVDLKCNGVSMLSTLLTFDNGEKTTTTATTPAAITTGDIPDDAEMQIDVTVQGGSVAAGLKVYLLAYVQQP
jgi:hypothetical protein